MTIHLTSIDVDNASRELCRRSLSYFVQRSWRILEPNATLKWGWALDAVCDHLQAVSDGRIRRLLITIPPGTMKSLLVSCFFPAWIWGPRDRPDLRFLGTSHKQDLATRDSLRCRRIITSDWFQAYWPVNLTTDQNVKTRFENDRTGFREAAAFTSLTGSRADVVILDDPHSVDDAHSRVKLDSDVRTFRESLQSRLNDDNSAIIIIMQRLHTADVAAVALELGYEHLCIPMRWEGEDRTRTALNWKDPRAKVGEIMFPERFNEAAVKELEVALGTHAASGQLQQKPVPDGGAIFKSEYVRHWVTVPPLEYRMIYADTAMKDKEINDFSVFQHWGKGRDGKIYLLDMMRGKWEAPQLLANAYAYWDKCRSATSGTLRKMKIEDKSSGTGLIQQMKQGGIPVEGIPRNRDKISRAYDTVPQMEAGNVLFPPRGEHLSDLLNELQLFPAAAHDDTIDPLMDAVQDMLISPRGYSWAGF